MFYPLRRPASSPDFVPAVSIDNKASVSQFSGNDWCDTKSLTVHKEPGEEQGKK